MNQYYINDMDEIRKFYYDADLGYINDSKKLHRKLINNGVDVSLKLVKQFLENQETVQVNKRIHTKNFNSVVAEKIRTNFQLDIIIYDRWQIDGYKYILCCIDVYSRFVQCRAMTNREMKNIMEKFKSIIQVMGIPENINCDNEFNKKEFNNYAEQNNIKMWYSQPNEINKNVIIERFNRTISEKIGIWREGSRLRKWYLFLNNLVKNYNNSVHSTTKNTPNDILFKKAHNEQEIKIVVNKFQEGDHVRISTTKTLFSKGDRIKFSKKVYEIDIIEGNKIYLSDDDSGKYYKPYELLKISKTELSKIPKTEEDKMEDLFDEYDEYTENQQQARKDKHLKNELKSDLNIEKVESKRVGKKPLKYS